MTRVGVETAGAVEAGGATAGHSSPAVESTTAAMETRRGSTFSFAIVGLTAARRGGVSGRDPSGRPGSDKEGGETSQSVNVSLVGRAA